MPIRSPRSGPAQPVRAHRGRMIALAALTVTTLAPTAAAAAATSSVADTASATSSASNVKPSPQTISNSRATFGIGPLPASKSDQRTFFSYQMGVGGKYSDKAVVYNYGVTSQRLSIYAADLGNNADGGINVGLPSQPFQDAGAWVGLGGKVLTANVPGKTSSGPGRVIVPFSIAVPRSASPGDHGAAIVAVLSTIGKNPKGENVRLDQRLATRIYIRINGALHPRLSIENLSVGYRQSMNPIGGGSAVVRYVVHNTGNVRLSAQQAVSVTGLFGTKSKVITPPGVQLLFPGGQQPVTVRVSGVFPSVFEKSHVTVTPSLFADQQSMPLSAAAASTGFTAIPWMLLVCLLGAIVLGVLIWLLYRRAKAQPQAKHGRGGPKGPDNRGGPKNSPAPTTPDRNPETLRS